VHLNIMSCQVRAGLRCCAMRFTFGLLDSSTSCYSITVSSLSLPQRGLFEIICILDF
jgi:hypothetical protein